MTVPLKGIRILSEELLFQHSSAHKEGWSLALVGDIQPLCFKSKLSFYWISTFVFSGGRSVWVKSFICCSNSLILFR